jgi:hypothetical protein
MNICESCTEPFGEDGEQTFVVNMPHSPPYERVLCEDCAQGYRASSYATEKDGGDT